MRDIALPLPSVLFSAIVVDILFVDMGNWNRRYQPRKKYKPNQYGEFPPPASRRHDTQSHVFGIDDNKVPSWEIDYCNSLKVPWYKILASKKYIYCYPTVLYWDDSAGEEAFQNAKQRYWAMINGCPCDCPLPDPDMFIDEIDWNPYMDPELVADIEHQYFNPDKALMVDQLETINEEVESAQAQEDMNQSTMDNPWEKNHDQGSGSLKDVVQGWNQWDSVILKSNNPWEQSCNQLVDSFKDNAWRSGNESQGWTKWLDNTQPSAIVDYKCGNPHSYGSQAMAGRQEGWGHDAKNSWSWSQGNANGQESRTFGEHRYSGENNYSPGLKERGWRDRGNESWVWREAEYQGNETNGWDSRRFGRGENSFRGGCRKRENSLNHTSKYKSYRHQGYNH